MIDGTTNAVTATIAVASSPTGLAVDPIRRRVYVAAAGYPGALNVIDADTLCVTATVPLGASPFAVGVNPATNRVYAVNQAGGSEANGDVWLIDGATLEIRKKVPVGLLPGAIAIRADRDLVYVGSLKTSEVYAFAGADLTLVR